LAVNAETTAAGFGAAQGDRPAMVLPLRQLVQLSIYWFGINAIWGAIDGVILQARMESFVGAGNAGIALALAKLGGVIVAILVQPTVGSISDYTMSRWGRRKPYIAIGASLDVLFLIAIATSNTFLALAAFLVLLQFSSNFAQGPFQGYVPDLVPAPQVGLASALVGVMTVLGIMGGQIIGYTGFLLGNNFTLPTIAVGLVEFATAVGTLLWVQEGRKPKDRGRRTWRQVALEAWGTDILREHSYVWLVASRLCILAGVGMIYNLNVFYMDRSMGLPSEQKALWGFAASACIAVTILIVSIPAARLADRHGRKTVIYGACAGGAAGMAILVLAPAMWVGLLGIVCVAAAAGSFLAVDWALMTDIIPKASSGRYMGMSNVATASAGQVALIVGGPLLTVFPGGLGPRMAMLAGALFFAAGAALLRPVDPSRREDPEVEAALRAAAAIA
jgi:MFS family permease